MLRVVVTVLISFLISFGAVSKSIQTSKLLNHIATKHAPHSQMHDHSHTHTHFGKDDQKKESSKKHSHEFDFSFSGQTMNFKAVSIENFVRPQQINSRETTHLYLLLIAKTFSLSIFRPPIS
jgi:ABC-type Zn2+ transport system substrate-binding protein/surface adhesin